MFPARVAFAKASETVSAKDGEDCLKFNATLKVFEKAAVANPPSVPLKTITSQTVEVLNGTAHEVHLGQEFLVAETIDERWVVIPGGRPRVQFKTDIHIVDRIVTAKVLRVVNFAPNLIGGELSPGDSITLHDPFNLRADIEADATGWAYLADSQVDDTDTENIDEGHQARYEIEDCSLPTNEIKGKLQSCLNMSDENVAVVISPSDYADPSVGILRSTYPSVDEPGGFTDVSGGYKQVTAYNSFNLHGVVESDVIIRRVTNRKFSDPENYATPLQRSHTQDQWEVVLVEKPFASFIKVRYTYNQGWEKVEEYDGYWPDNNLGSPFATCDPGITCDLCECLPTSPDDGEVFGYAHFDGLTGNYKVTSTKSAFYGNGETVNIDEIQGFRGCNLTFNERQATVFCLGDPTLKSVSLPVDDVDVMVSANIYQGCGGQCKWVVAGFECGTEDEQPAYTWDDPDNDGNGNWTLTNAGASCSTCTGVVIRQEPPTAGSTHGQTGTGRCLRLDWNQIEFCTGSGCSCTPPPTISSSNSLNEAYTSECTGTPSNVTDALCFHYSTQTVTVLDCAGYPSSGVQNPPTCIPKEDLCCDEGGGGTTECSGTCTWAWNSAIFDWELQTNTCTPSPCSCFTKPTGVGTVGETRNVACDASAPSCNQCEECPSEFLELQDLTWGKLASTTDATPPGAGLFMDVSYDVVLGSARFTQDCTIEADINWNGNVTGGGGTYGPSPDTVVITFNGSAWEVRPVNGCPWTADTGDFDAAKSATDCSVNYQGVSGNSAGISNTDAPASAVTVTLQIDSTPC